MSITSKQRFCEFRRKRIDEPRLGEPQAHWSARRRYLGQYYRWVSAYRGRIAIVFALALIASVLGLVMPYATKVIVDGVLLDKGMERAAKFRMLHWIGGGLIVLLLVQQGIEAVRTYLMTILNARVIFRLRQRLYNHLLRLPLHELAELKVGGITSRLSGDVDEVSGLVQMAIITPGVAIIRVVLTLAVLMALNWQMALVAALLIPPIVLINFLYIRKIRPLYRSMRRDRSEIDGRVAETFGGIRVVRVFGREHKEARDYAVGHHTIIRKRVLTEALQLVVTTGWGLLIPMASLIIIWYGGTRFLLDRCTIGAIMAFQMYVFMLLHPVSQIVFSYGQTQRALAAMERTFALMERPTDKPDSADAIEPPGPVREIRFDHVFFEYRAGHPVLQDFALAVPAGQTVALVGPSGAGKTTVTNLVARFYDATGGAVRLNGIDLRQIRLGSYRQLIGVVEQDVFLFDGTVRENIAFSKRDASDGEVVEAGKRGNAHEFIMNLPEGYDTLIGERGIRLSGGQRQRLSIARALLADPQILILDEATSNLDTESEQLIQASLAELLAGRTTFVIAHRLSTVMHADLIVVMEDGRIVEQGRHEELMAAGGRYQEMIARQMRIDADALTAWA
jgi:ATP-binding cassette subfamily B protein